MIPDLTDRECAVLIVVIGRVTWGVWMTGRRYDRG